HGPRGIGETSPNRALGAEQPAASMPTAANSDPGRRIGDLLHQQSTGRAKPYERRRRQRLVAQGMTQANWQEQLRRGSLDLAILLSVASGPRYGCRRQRTRASAVR